MTHDEWQGQIQQLAERLRWNVLHVRKAQEGKAGKWRTTTNIKGWPDLWLWHAKHGFLAIECKVGRDRPTPEQLDVLASLAAAGAATLVAYPADVDAVIALLQTGKLPVGV